MLALSLLIAPLPNPTPNGIAASRRAERAQGEAANQKPTETLWQRTKSDPIILYTFVLAIFSGALVVLTLVLAGVGIWQGVLTRRAVNLTRDEFEATHRPWIKVEISTEDDLTWGADGQGNLAVNVKMTNIGNGPALYAWPYMTICMVAGPDADPYKWQRTQAEVARQRVINPNMNFGHTILPGDFATQTISVMIPKADIERAEALWRSVQKTGDACLMPSIVGCVTYRFAFSAVEHQTGFIRHVRQYGDADPSGNYCITTKKSVSRIRLDGDPFAGDMAN